MSCTRYRVETFIIPLYNDHSENNSGPKTDDAKLTDKLKNKEIDDSIIENESLSISYNTDNKTIESDSVIQRADSLISALEESLQDARHSASSEDVNDNNEYENTGVRNIVEFDFSKSSQLTIPDTHTLGAIEEACEDTDEKESDLCYHGCKNGCSAIVPTPQEVSQEVFRDHWLQKLEEIKKKETSLKNRECILQSRERGLFMREREVRILERDLRIRLKQVESYLRQIKSPQMKDQQLDTSDLKKYITSEICDSKRIKNKISSSEKLYDSHSTSSHLYIQDKTNLDNVINKEIEEQKRLAISSSSSESNVTEESKGTRQSSRSSLASKGFGSSTSKFSSHPSRRVKKTHKPSYEDLDTTLSADIGDSSFIQTSQKFNPDLYKRPYAFRRTFSERRPKPNETKSYTNLGSQSIFLQKQNFKQGEIEPDKILQRVTKNISASKEKSTKFQHYGLIDQNVDVQQNAHYLKDDIKDEKKYSYLNLEVGLRTSLQKLSQQSKERPTSWNEGTDQWLQRKRQAYNLATKKVLTEDLENKENMKCNAKKDKVNTVPKKRDITNKLFTIFR